MDTNNPAYSDVNGVLFDNAQSTLVEYPGGLGGSSILPGGYTLPGSVTSIGSYAFEGCDGLAGIALPGGLTNIGSYAFDTASTSPTPPFPEGS